MPAATTAAPARPLTWGPHEVPVPYVVRWSSERVSARGVTVRADGSGLSYEDERPADRDAHGVLWAREPHTPGEGRPDYRSMHSSRQRSVVRTLSCQVCGGQADRNGQGWFPAAQLVLELRRVRRAALPHPSV